MDYPPAVRDVIREYGDITIDAVKVVRKPIMGVLSGIIELISLGQFSANKAALGYDDMYHLYIYVRLSNGVTIRMEKNQVFNFAVEDSYETGDAAAIELYIRGQTISRRRNINNVRARTNDKINMDTINEMLPVARTAYTHLFPDLQYDDWWKYNGANNNCQVFVYSCLYAFGLVDDPRVHDFVLQDTKKIVGTLNSIAVAIMNGATDTAAMLDLLIHGAGK